jgi:hypothetical protein
MEQKKTIDQHITDDLIELDNPIVNSQRRRHLEDEVEQLERYKNNHPTDDHDPSPLELYCDENPEALECRIYDD